MNDRDLKRNWRGRRPRLRAEALEGRCLLSGGPWSPDVAFGYTAPFTLAHLTELRAQRADLTENVFGVDDLIGNVGWSDPRDGLAIAFPIDVIDVNAGEVNIPTDMLGDGTIGGGDGDYFTILPWFGDHDNASAREYGQSFGASSFGSPSTMSVMGGGPVVTMSVSVHPTFTPDLGKWQTTFPFLADAASAVANVLMDEYADQGAQTLVMGMKFAAEAATSIVDVRYQAARATTTPADYAAAAPAVPRTPVASTDRYGSLDGGLVDLGAVHRDQLQAQDAVIESGTLTDAELEGVPVGNGIGPVKPTPETDRATRAATPHEALAATSLEGGLIALADMPASRAGRAAPTENEAAVAVRKMQASVGVFQAFDQAEDAHDVALASFLNWPSREEPHEVAPPVARTAAEDPAVAGHSYQRALVNALLGLAFYGLIRRYRRAEDAEQAVLTPHATLPRQGAT